MTGKAQSGKPLKNGRLSADKSRELVRNPLEIKPEPPLQPDYSVWESHAKETGPQWFLGRGVTFLIFRRICLSAF